MPLIKLLISQMLSVAFVLPKSQKDLATFWTDARNKVATA